MLKTAVEPKKLQGGCMTHFRGRRGFSLLELLIALSIIIIMTGAATLYLGDILFKSKVSKAKNDMETFVTALTLHDAENPSSQLDSGLIGASPASRIRSTEVTERDTLANLVGTYLLALPNDPWGAGYKVNSYMGYVKTYAEDYALSGTSKYDKDIMSFYLPENLFLAKVRADDLNGNTVLDTGDEIQLYFSKSVRCNLNAGAAVANRGNTAYDGTDAAAFGARITPYGIPVLDVHTNKVHERSIVDGNGIPAGDGTVATENKASWTAHDLMSFRPGDYDASTNARHVEAGYDLKLGEAGGDEGSAHPESRATYGFHRPTDALFYASFFSRRLKFWMPGTNESRGSDATNIDVGYEMFIPTTGVAQALGNDFHLGYCVWESSQAYGAYKTTGDKNKLYLQQADLATSRRTLIFKTIVD